MRLVCVSDTHNRHHALDVPPGDVFVHAGDWSTRGTFREHLDFVRWVGTLPHKYKIVVAGNHDLAAEKLGKHTLEDQFDEVGAEYLEGETAVIPFMGHTVRFWGGPWIPEIWGAYNVSREILGTRWGSMPDGPNRCHVIVTHAPAADVLDRVLKPNGTLGVGVGCVALGDRLDVVRPLVHVHGHIHESRGEARTPWGRAFNVSSADRWYGEFSPPVVVDIDPLDIAAFDDHCEALKT